MSLNFLSAGCQDLSSVDWGKFAEVTRRLGGRRKYDNASRTSAIRGIAARDPSPDTRCEMNALINVIVKPA